MHKKAKHLFFLLLFGLTCFSSFNTVNAQTFEPEPCLCDQERQYEKNFNTWGMYVGTYRFADKFSLHAEGQVRRQNGVSDWQQWFVRSGLNYHASENAMLTAGYLHARSFALNAQEIYEDNPEHRLFEQILLRQQEGIFGLQHRFRLEQRWVKAPLADDFVYTNRARYMIRAALPLSGRSIDPQSPYVAFSNEIFINFGENVQKNIFDQNRLWGGLGYRVNDKLALELGYMNQQVQCANGYEFKNNHTLTFGIFHNLDLRKNKG